MQDQEQETQEILETLAKYGQFSNKTILDSIPPEPPLPYHGSLATNPALTNTKIILKSDSAVI